eukprot:6409364-Pyramimonas_sp.AAC.1
MPFSIAVEPPRWLLYSGGGVGVSSHPSAVSLSLASAIDSAAAAPLARSLARSARQGVVGTQ